MFKCRFVTGMQTPEAKALAVGFSILRIVGSVDCGTKSHTWRIAFVDSNLLHMQIVALWAGLGPQHPSTESLHHDTYSRSQKVGTSFSSCP